MRKVLFFASFSLVSFCFVSLSTSYVVANCETHGAVHMILPDGEEEVDDGSDELICEGQEYGMEPHPWYSNEKFEAYSDEGDPTANLEDDTAWPGQQQEFSETLFRMWDR